MSQNNPSNSSEAPENALGLKYSFILHLSLILGVFLNPFFFRQNYQFVPPTLRVDLVDLPDLSKSELARLKNLPKPIVPKNMPPQELSVSEKPKKNLPEKKAEIELEDPDTMILSPRIVREKKLKNVIEKMKTLEKIRSSVTSSEESGTTIKGNILSKGASMSPDAKEALNENYLDSIRDHLKENWELPVWLARQELSAQVALSLDKRGQMVGFKIVKSSGNPRFDELVKKTILNSTPFPRPPDAISATIVVDGILVGFPL